MVYFSTTFTLAIPKVENAGKACNKLWPDSTSVIIGAPAALMLVNKLKGLHQREHNSPRRTVIDWRWKCQSFGKPHWKVHCKLHTLHKIRCECVLSTYTEIHSRKNAHTQVRQVGVWVWREEATVDARYMGIPPTSPPNNGVVFNSLVWFRFILAKIWRRSKMKLSMRKSAREPQMKIASKNQQFTYVSSLVYSNLQTKDPQ